MRKPFTSALLSGIIFIVGISAQADSVRYLDRGKTGLSSFYQNIVNSKKSIDMTYHIWDPCHSVTKVLVEAMSQKAKKENVKVRLQIDAHYHSADLQAAYTEQLRAKGIEVRYFNTGYHTINNRTHAKLSVFDNEKYITGGRNMDDSYYGVGEGLNWVDREVEVKGASASGAVESFKSIWNSNLSVAIPPNGKPAAKAYARPECTQWTKKDAAMLAALKANSGKWLAEEKTIQCSDVRFEMDTIAFANLLVDRNNDTPSEQIYMNSERKASKPTTRELVKLLKGAQKSILSENYSYITPGELGKVIAEKRAEGRKIEVYSNNYAEDEHAPVSMHSYGGLKEDNQGSQKNYAISQLGAMNERWELTPKVDSKNKKVDPKFMIHSKVYVVDKKHSMIGSFNIDPRSYHTNIESGVFARNCPALATRIEDSSKLLHRVYEEDRKACTNCKDNLQKGFFDSLYLNIIKDLL